MTRYRCELAKPGDDAALRQLMAGTPMPGSVALTFRREPSYFASDCVLGPKRQTLIIRDTVKSEIVMVATRAVREMYIGEQRQRVGYLGGLRLLSRVHGQGLLARGYRFLRDLHDSDLEAPAFYLTTIAEGNTPAIRSLTSGRAGLPTYQPLCRLHTLVLPIRRRSAPPKSRTSGFRVERLTDLQELLEFFDRCATKKTFFPAYSSGDFRRCDSSQQCGTFRNLDTSSIMVARRGNEVIGAAGVWDQRSFRQTIVDRYSRLTGAIRPMVNQWSRMTGGLSLPEVGRPLDGCFVCFPVVKNGDEAVLRMLLRQLMQVAPPSAKFLLLGLCDGDSLLPIAQRFSRTNYTTRLFGVSWKNLPDSITTKSASPYYLELGCL